MFNLCIGAWFYTLLFFRASIELPSLSAPSGQLTTDIQGSTRNMRDVRTVRALSQPPDFKSAFASQCVDATSIKRNHLLHSQLLPIIRNSFFASDRRIDQSSVFVVTVTNILLRAIAHTIL